MMKVIALVLIAFTVAGCQCEQTNGVTFCQQGGYGYIVD